MCFIPFFSGWTYGFSLHRRHRRKTTLNQNRWPARDSGLRKHRLIWGKETSPSRVLATGAFARSLVVGWKEIYWLPADGWLIYLIARPHLTTTAFSIHVSFLRYWKVEFTLLVIVWNELVGRGFVSRRHMFKQNFTWMCYNY